MLVPLSVDVGSLREGEVRVVMVEGRRLLLVQGSGTTALVDSICPHAGGDLSMGKVSGDRLQCPVHRYMFDLRTGGCAAARREGWEPLRTYAVEEIDGSYHARL